jgi:tungstate transport system permease protein
MHDFAQAIVTALSLIASFDSEIVGIVGLSLRVSLSASLIAMMIGAPLGAVLAVSRFRGRQAVIVLANALLGLPPVVAGLFIYLLLSRSGPLGFAGLLFSPTAMIIAQAVITTPIVIALVHRPTSLLWSEYADLMRTDGVSKARSIQLLFLIGRDSLLTAFLAAFGRAIAEVGAIIIVGGNIRGYTRTMTTAIALETGKGDLTLALALGLILLSLSVIVSSVAFLLVGRVGEK